MRDHREGMSKEDQVRLYSTLREPTRWRRPAKAERVKPIQTKIKGAARGKARRILRSQQ